MSDLVSWLLVERGWKVVGADGAQLGTVDEVVGDTEVDIFNGLTVTHGMLGTPRYVPAEQVREIREGRVQLRLDRDGFDRLDERRGTAARRAAPPSDRVR